MALDSFWGSPPGVNAQGVRQGYAFDVAKSTFAPCTSSALPKAPRGGKGFDRRHDVYLTEKARVESLYCGRTDDRSSRLMTMGPAAGRYSTAAMGNGEAPAFCASCKMGLSFMGHSDVLNKWRSSQSVNPCNA